MERAASVERGMAWDAKGRGTRDLDPMWSYGPDRGVGAWTVAMETDTKPTNRFGRRAPST